MADPGEELVARASTRTTLHKSRVDTLSYGRAVADCQSDGSLTDASAGVILNSRRTGWFQPAQCLEVATLDVWRVVRTNRPPFMTPLRRL